MDDREYFEQLLDSLLREFRNALQESETRQRLYTSQRLEAHFDKTKALFDETIEGAETRLTEQVLTVRAASETAHAEIIERLERLEGNQ